MSGANTNVESLEAALRAVVEFQGETDRFYRGTGLALDSFDAMVAEEFAAMRDKLDEVSHQREGRRDGDPQADQHQAELDQMLYEYEAGGKREQREVEERYAELTQLVRQYEADRSALAERLQRLMQGETMAGGAHGLRELIGLLQDYLDY